MRLVVIIVLAVLGSIHVESCDDERKGTLELLSKIINGLGGKHEGAIGAIFTRWGKESCPKNKSELVYSGFVGGSHYTHKGAAAEYLCLPPDPDWGRYSDSATNYVGNVYGAEYESWSESIPIDKSYRNWEVPCAVCRTVGSTSVMMIPGKNKCMDSWTKQYSGYLMSGRINQAPSQYICVDGNAEKIGTKTNLDGKLLVPVEARCGSLRCPPYKNGRELTCVVCAK